MSPDRAKQAIEEAWKAPEINFSELPEDPRILRGMLRSLLAETTALCAKGQRVEERLMLELLRRYGRSSERHDGHLPLFEGHELPEEPAPDPDEAAEDSEPDDKDSGKPKRKKGKNGRRKLPDSLPREEIVLDLDEDMRCCLGCKAAMTRIGEEITEQLDYVPASLIVRRFVRPKYACRSCQDGVLTAEPPGGPIRRGLPGAGLLAQVVTAKFADHLPLNRQEAIFGRHGLEIPRSTLCDWIAAAARLAQPLYDLMVKQVLAGRKIHTDDTGVLVLAGRNRGAKHKRRQKKPGAKASSKGYLWVYVGDRDHPNIVYDYTPSRSGRGPAKFLDTFKGYAQVDDFKGYDALFSSGDRKKVACWAHVRRKFHDAKVSDPARAKVALDMIRELYLIERESHDVTDDDRKRARAEKAKPVLDRIEAWLLAERPCVLPKSQIARAIRYAANLWPCLIRYVTDGALSIDNNEAERAIRPIAVGRKNWLFAGSDEGARRGALLMSLVATCKRHEACPFAYLRDLFDTLPTFRGDLVELTPLAWKARQSPAG